MAGGNTGPGLQKLNAFGGKSVSFSHLKFCATVEGVLMAADSGQVAAGPDQRLGAGML